MQKYIFTCFLFALSSCQKTPVVEPEPAVGFSIVGYLNVPNAKLIKAYKKGWNELYHEEILEVNRQTGAYTWTLICTTTKSERYEDLEWYIWDETLW